MSYLGIFALPSRTFLHWQKLRACIVPRTPSATGSRAHSAGRSTRQLFHFAPSLQSSLRRRQLLCMRCALQSIQITHAAVPQAVACRVLGSISYISSLTPAVPLVAFYVHVPHRGGCEYLAGCLVYVVRAARPQAFARTSQHSFCTGSSFCT